LTVKLFIININHSNSNKGDHQIVCNYKGICGYICNRKYNKDKKTKTAMRNLAKTFIFALTLTSSFAFAGNSDDKMKVANVKNTLPASLPAIESPAPERKTNVSVNQTVYSPQQKAALVGLKLENAK
jgi:hypothetical protein